MPKKPNSKKANKSSVDDDERALSILTHVLAIFLGFLAPLIILIASKNKNVKAQSKESLNWQISFMIYIIISIILIIILVGIPFLIALGILNLIFCILAAVKASEGELYRYPLTIRFIK